jgi:hypothetical protein
VAYSLLRHIAQSVLFGNFSGRTQVAMFTAYFDASGTKKMPVLTVAGFVSHVKRWDRFERKWSLILKRYGVSTLHMTEFVSSKGEFTTWRGDSERRRRFITDLADCIKQETKRGFAASIVIPEYEEINREYILSETVGQPYTMAASACLGGLQTWIEKRKHNLSDVLVAVEEGDDDQGEFIARVRQQGFKALPFPKTYAQAFQAGDLVGWKCRTPITNALRTGIPTQEDGDNIMRSLDPIRGIVQNNGVYDMEALRALCETHKIPRRRGRISA